MTTYSNSSARQNQNIHYRGKKRKETIFHEKIPRTGDDIFLVNHFEEPQFDYPLHYHVEYELTYIDKCSGTRIVGDDISEFENSDLVFLGKNLPHQWQKDEDIHYKNSRIITVQFGEEIFSEYLINTSLFKPLKILLEKSQRGIQIKGKAAESIKKRLRLLLKQKGFVAFNNFMAILQILSNNEEQNECVASVGYTLNPEETKSMQINRVNHFILNNYSENISQKDVAQLIGMSESAFSHFFKKHTNLSFTDFLINVRLGNASKLLLETTLYISEICYQTGFRNIANFNRQFRKRYGSTPSEYRRNAKKSLRGKFISEGERLIKY